MEKTSDPWVIIGATAGLVGAGLFSLMWIVAAIVDGHWVLGEQTLSELGGNRPGSVFFNSGAIVEGVLAQVFTLGLWRAMQKSALQKTGIILLLVASSFLILVGVFPITTGWPHTVASYAFFGLALAGTLVMIRPLWIDEGFGPVAGMTALGAVIVSLAFLSLTSIELTEAVGVICLLAWSSLLSAMMLRRESRAARS